MINTYVIVIVWYFMTSDLPSLGHPFMYQCKSAVLVYCLEREKSHILDVTGTGVIVLAGLYGMIHFTLI